MKTTLSRIKIMISPALVGLPLSIFLFSCGGGGGGSGPGPEPPAFEEVGAYYYVNGANWNDYVKNDGADIFTASGAAATGAETGGYPAVIHGGEMRAVGVSGLSDTAGLTASDGLGAFDWAFHASGGKVRCISTGLKQGKYLSDLINFDDGTWKENSVTVLKDGSFYAYTSSAVWWDNSIAVQNGGASLGAAGRIYIVTSSFYSPAIYAINANKVALVVQPTKSVGTTSTTQPPLSNAVIFAQGRKFLHIEGDVNATGNVFYGLKLYNVKFSVVRRMHVYNDPVFYSVYLDHSSNNSLSDLTASDNSGGDGISLSFSSYNTLANLTASNNDVGVDVSYSSDNTLSNLTLLNNGSIGANLNSSHRNALLDVSASGSSTGVYLVDSSNNSLSHLNAANNSTGVDLYEARNNTLTDLTACNNNTGVYVHNSPDNNLSGVTASNNSSAGVYLDTSRNNTLSNVTAANNGTYGVLLFAPAYLSTNNNITLCNLAATNNYYGLKVNYSSNNTFSNLATADNDYGVSLDSSSDHYFTGLLKVGNNSRYDAEVISCTNPGIDNVTCLPSPPSDATFTSGVSFADSFAAKVADDDTVNVSDFAGTASYSAMLDWTSFENPFRGWGRDGNAFADSTNRGRATSGTCRIWDWSMTAADTGDHGSPLVLDVLTAPGAADTLTHTWSNSTSATFLRNAVEIMDDGIGNDNSLCEAGEACIFTRNIGSYQGHGDLVFHGTVTLAAGNVSLYRYSINGY